MPIALGIAFPVPGAAVGRLFERWVSAEAEELQKKLRRALPEGACRARPRQRCAAGKSSLSPRLSVGQAGPTPA